MKQLRNSVHLIAVLALAPLTVVAFDPPEVSATADAHGNYGIPNNVDVSVASSGSVSAKATQPSYNVISYTDAKSRLGTLFGHVKAVDEDGYYYASGSTDSRWRDIVTINATGKKGQLGVATLNFKVVGTSSFQTNDQNCSTEVSASATVLNNATWALNRRLTSYPNGSFIGDNFLGKVQSMDFSFAYGDPFQLTVILNARSGTSGSSGGVGFAETSAQLIWLGFTNIRAADSVTKVPDATVRSQSATNYSRPIGIPSPTVTIRSSLTQLTESPEQTSTVTLLLNSPAPAPLKIGLAYTGTATAKSDYATLNPFYVSVSKGSTQASFTINSKNDTLVEAPEQVSIHVLPGLGYGVGVARTAEITIISED